MCVVAGLGPLTNSFVVDVYANIRHSYILYVPKFNYDEEPPNPLSRSTDLLKPPMSLGRQIWEHITVK